MNKKLTGVLVLSLAIALAFGGIAYGVAFAADHVGQSESVDTAAVNAQAADPAQVWARQGLGKVIAIGTDQFTVQRRNGVERVILVDDQTRYFDAHGTAITFADLQIGRWVAGHVVPSADGLLGRLVIQLPEGFDPNIRLIRHAGTVEGVNPSANTFLLTTLQGERLNFQVDENTIYMGQVSSLVDLQVGMSAVVRAQQLDDGSYLAVRLTARQKPQVDVKTIGRVNGLEASSFTLRSRDGQTHTFQVTPQTRFRGPGLNGLRDLKLGIPVAVAAQDAGNGQYRALLVIGRGR